MTKSVPPGVAAQRGGKKLSLEAQIDAVVTLAWMANGMELPTGAIAKVANASIALELAIRKIWSRMKQVRRHHKRCAARSSCPEGR